ncbi:MAG TPA: ankyrin repeat domain-containing protein [Gammaproteobacteria bacterium]|nr:ankyrin repeat domain-containing protein [Gammaproteobacteria bacterium]
MHNKIIDSFLYALVQGNAEAVADLLEAGYVSANSAKFSDFYEGFTPLAVVAHHGQYKLIRLLLVYGAQIEKVLTRGSCVGMSPLGVAINAGHVETARELIINGADVNGLITTGPYVGFSHLRMALMRKNAACIKLLIDEWADPSCLVVNSPAISTESWNLLLHILHDQLQTITSPKYVALAIAIAASVHHLTVHRQVTSAVEGIIGNILEMKFKEICAATDSVNERINNYIAAYDALTACDVANCKPTLCGRNVRTVVTDIPVDEIVVKLRADMMYRAFPRFLDFERAVRKSIDPSINFTQDDIEYLTVMYFSVSNEAIKQKLYQTLANAIALADRSGREASSSPETIVKKQDMAEYLEQALIQNIKASSNGNINGHALDRVVKGFLYMYSGRNSFNITPSIWEKIRVDSIQQYNAFVEGHALVRRRLYTPAD